MKKFTTIIVIITFLTNTTTVRAEFMGLTYKQFNASLSFSLVGPYYVAVGYYQYMKDLIKPTITPTGDVIRQSEAQWIDLTLMPPQNVVMPINAKINKEALETLADEKNPDGSGKYPNTHNALHMSSILGLQWPDTVGDIRSIPGVGNRKINFVEVSNNPDCFWTAPPSYVLNAAHTSVRMYQLSSRPNYCKDAMNGNNQIMSFDSKAFSFPETPYTATERELLPTEYVPKLQTSATDISSGTAYTNELNSMFQNPNYVPSFSDSTTGLPYSPPPSSSVATPEQVQAYNAKQQPLEDAKTAATTTATAATGSATTAAATAASGTSAAGQAYTASGGNLTTGAGGDPTLYKAYLDSKSKSDAAQADLDKLKASQAAAAAQQVVDDAQSQDNLTNLAGTAANKYTGFTDSDKPTKTDLKAIIQGYINNSPLVVLIKKLTVTTTTENALMSFNFHGQKLDVDFSRYAGMLATAGSALLGLSHMYALYIIFRREEG